MWLTMLAQVGCRPSVVDHFWSNACNSCFLYPQPPDFFQNFPTFFYLLDFVLPVNARPAPPLTLAPSPFCCPFKRRGLSSLVPPGVERRTPRALRRMAHGSSGQSPLVPGGAGRSLARPPLNLTPANFRTPQALPSATHACTPVSPHHPPHMPCFHDPLRLLACAWHGVYTSSV